MYNYLQNLDSPWVETGAKYLALLGNKSYLDERLKVINAELEKYKVRLKECSNVSTIMIVFTSLPNFVSLCVLLVF